MSSRARRWPLITAGLIAGLVALGFASYQYAIRSLKTEVIEALGPHSEVREIRMGLTGLEILGVRIAPPQTRGEENAWPEADVLRAERIVVEPAILDFLLGERSLQKIRIEKAFLSIQRAPNGKFRLLPELLEKPAGAGRGDSAPAGQTASSLLIQRVELIDSTIEFFDAAIRRPAHKLRIERINAAFGKIRLPELKGFTTVDLVGVLKGERTDGKISLSGDIEPSTRDSGLMTRLRGIDLIALQPYLLKAADTRVKKGTLDLELNVSVRNGRLHAPGTMTIKDLELATASPSARFMGMPRSAVIELMKSHNGEIDLKFVLDGNVNDPRFSLNEHLAARIGTSLAGALGIRIENLARGVGQIGGNAAKGVGETLKKLIE